MLKGYRIVFGEILLIVFIATALSCLIRGIYETFRLDVSFSVLGNGNKSLKVILISDLHARYFNVSLNRLISVIEKSGADVILFAGDFTNGGSLKEKRKASVVVSRIADTACKKLIPFYAVYGNHDIYGTADMLEGIDIRILSNESVLVSSKDGSRWKIVGLQDLKRGNPDYCKAKLNYISVKNCKKENLKNISETKLDEKKPESIYSNVIADFNSIQYTNNQNNHLQTKLDQFIDNEKLIDPNRDADQQYYPEIILAHNPDTIFKLPSDSSSFEQTGQEACCNSISGVLSNSRIKSIQNNRFLLSGHFHGGQIWMPFDLEYKLLRKEKMARLGYRKGPFEYLGFHGYISRGLGCVIVPLRFFSYPEISILELRAD